MTEIIRYDLSRDTLEATFNGICLSKHRFEQTIDQVYDEFSGDAPIQTHLLDLSAVHHLQNQDVRLPIPNLATLRRFEYLSSESLHPDALRTKGAIAISMIQPELFGGELSAELVEPFKDVAVLPALYRRWQARRSGWSIPRLYL